MVKEMSEKKNFRLFVERLFNNSLKEDDWESFAITHYNDEDLEKARVRIVRCFYPEFRFHEISDIQRNELLEIFDDLKRT